MTRYLLDANVFIQAENLHYGFDFCPAFWDWLIDRNQDGTVASVEKVADELHGIDDDLAAWARVRGESFFLRPDDAVVPALGTVSDWAGNAGRTSRSRHLSAGCRLLARRSRAGASVRGCHPRSSR